MTDTIIQINGGENAYSAEQVAERALTLGALIEALTEMTYFYGNNAKVVFAGYGGGAVFEPVRGVTEAAE